MNRFYNHIKHLVDSNEIIHNINTRPQWQEVKCDTNQLYGKQRQTGFNYYEHDVPKFRTPGWVQSELDQNRVNLQEHLENLENDQARHQGIHGHGRGESCFSYCGPPDSSHKSVLCKYRCAKCP